MNIKKKYCGYIIIVGKPNVGKSTFINSIIGTKISIVSKRKNTTQKNILGIKTDKCYQSIYIDTPGVIFNKKKYESLKNNTLHKIIKNSVLIIFITDRIYWDENDEAILEKIKKHNIPIILLINKVDKIHHKNTLLPHINFLKKKMNFIEIIPISVNKTKSLSFLEKIIKSFLPKNDHIYDKNEITTNSQLFIISEIIREQTILRLRDELPEVVRVKIKSLEKTKKQELYISSIIYVKNIHQKKIIIGAQGMKIKNISITSRLGIEKHLNIKTHLKLWVKIDTKN